MHRFIWDMHYDPIPGSGGGGRGGGGGAAVPHRTYAGVNSPWVAPGTYSVRLTAGGQSVTQPITIKMDPRVKITPEVQQIFTLTTKMEDHATNAAAAYKEARELVEKLKARPQSAANDALIKKVEEIAPRRSCAEWRRGAEVVEEAPRNRPLRRISLISPLRSLRAVQGMQAAEMPPTVLELQACAKAEATYTALMAKWNALKASNSK